MKTVEILVNTKEFGWCLECIANEENYQRVLEGKRKQFPDKEFKAEELTEEESKNAWYNQGWID